MESSSASSQQTASASKLSNETIKQFTADYYEHLAADDLSSYDPDVLQRRALLHRRIADGRRPGTATLDIVHEDRGAHDAPDSVIYIVNDDMPFLVDSVMAEVVRQSLAITLVVHPLFLVTRDAEHAVVSARRIPNHSGVSSGDTSTIPNLQALLGAEGEQASTESWIAIEVGEISEEKRSDLLAGLEKVLRDVRAAVKDWPKMRDAATACARDLKNPPIGVDQTAFAEAAELLTQMDRGIFTFLGYREYVLSTRDGADVLKNVPGSGLGILRDQGDVVKAQELTPAGWAKAREKAPLVITKANSRSTVHRTAYLDYVGVKTFDEAGQVTGERRFIGLFATSVFTSSVLSLPVVREKVKSVLAHFGFAKDSHSGKDLLTILESYPRAELFQTDVADLISISESIMRLQERRRTRLFLRPDAYGRFMSAMVYLPRDRYTTSVRLRIEQALREAFKAESLSFEVQMSESALARLFYRIRLPRTADVTAPEVNREDLERTLARAVRSWPEGMAEVFRENYGQDEGAALAQLWADAFPASYRVDFEVEDAIADVQKFQQLQAQAEQFQSERAPLLTVYRPADRDQTLAPREDARVKLYLNQAESLSGIIPFFQHLGLAVLDERPFEITRADGHVFFLYDLGLKYPDGVDPEQTEPLLQDSFAAAMSGGIESDRFNRLVLQERLSARQVSVLRAYTKYLRQSGNASSFSFIADTLLANPEVARALIALFEAKFDPSYGAESDIPERASALDVARSQMLKGLDLVPTLDADRVLRSLQNLIEATERTNYFQDKPYLSFKLNPQQIRSLPSPRPQHEIWVYSPRVEGVHLRFGKVARGGLRWSDRREDFRTEILGLVKAQTVKNAVIVPTGAKGGFFPKQLPDPRVDRAAWMLEGTEAYKVFIRALLDVTDNRVADLENPGTERVVHPDSVVRYDGDDSYLVVAADKGTASFSDTANAISADYDFWLGDAFASGGSVGYDHKAMGITARGAWESVKRHFSELDVDTQSEDFTVVGVGDMSGDVFGNGMLLSKHIKLLAAFDHRHVFLDPNPDPDLSYAERRRLFELPRSSWMDYKADLISEGGGVYARDAKSIPVSAEVRAALGLPEGTTQMSPPELLRAILLAPADLLYNGGIGTYVKASTETNSEVGDRANDAIRVDGQDLRVKVVGEGGNLGLTQRGRIEAALRGVILNTDAIDNSAGVDCSDHEVNIKIFVDRMVAAGKLEASKRAVFLAAMTDQVGELVLADNIAQNILLLNDRTRVLEWSPSYERMMDWLEIHADLDRELEALPTSVALHKRLESGQGLTSPELSVLAAYAKIELASSLRKSAVVDDPWFEQSLREYFPHQIRDSFSAELQSHPLRKDIVATIIANDMINAGGITFAFRAMEETNASEAAVATAFVAMREIFDLDQMLAQVNALPASFPTEHWTAIHLDIRRFLDRGVRWLINHTETSEQISVLVQRYQPVIAELREHLRALLTGIDVERVDAAVERAAEWGVPTPLRQEWAELFESFALLDIARISGSLAEPTTHIAQVYYTVFAQFEVDSLLERISSLPRKDRWQALARAALRDDLYSIVADITISVIRNTEQGLSASDRFAGWAEKNQDSLSRATSMFEDVNKLEQDDMASLSVALRLLRSIVRR